MPTITWLWVKYLVRFTNDQLQENYMELLPFPEYTAIVIKKINKTVNRTCRSNLNHYKGVKAAGASYILRLLLQFAKEQVG